MLMQPRSKYTERNQSRVSQCFYQTNALSSKLKFAVFNTYYYNTTTN